VFLRNVGNVSEDKASCPQKPEFFRSKFWVEYASGDGKFRHAGAACSDARPSDFIHLNTDRTTPVGDAWENAFNPASASKLFAPRWELVAQPLYVTVFFAAYRPLAILALVTMKLE
jgi:hypothetical protein